jgi:hypothetical protein
MKVLRSRRAGLSRGVTRWPHDPAKLSRSAFFGSEISSVDAKPVSGHPPPWSFSPSPWPHDPAKGWPHEAANWQSRDLLAGRGRVAVSPSRVKNLGLRGTRTRIGYRLRLWRNWMRRIEDRDGIARRSPVASSFHGRPCRQGVLPYSVRAAPALDHPSLLPNARLTSGRRGGRPERFPVAKPFG